MKELDGKAKENNDRLITNFIVDSYLQRVKTASTQKGVNVEVFRFEKGMKKKQPKDLLKGKGDLSVQDAVFFSCNNSSSEHWFLGVVLPQERYIVVLDSLPGLFVKPTVLTRVEKMVSFLQRIDQSIDIKQWSFYTNKPDEIPSKLTHMIVVSLLPCMQDAWQPGVP